MGSALGKADMPWWQKPFAQFVLKSVMFLLGAYYRLMSRLLQLPILGRFLINPLGKIMGNWLDQTCSYLLSCMQASGGNKHFHGGVGRLTESDHIAEGVKRALQDTTEASALNLDLETSVLWESGWQAVVGEDGLVERCGYFLTPLLHTNFLRYSKHGELLDEHAKNQTYALIESWGEKAHFKIIAPRKHAAGGSGLGKSTFGGLRTTTPIIVAFPAFGDQGFFLRSLQLAFPLAKGHGIATIMLEQYSYGKRRCHTKQSAGVVLDRVEDLFIKGSATISEGSLLVRHLHALGFRQICSSGMSMGGGMALIVGASAPFKLAIAAIVPAHRPGPVFTDHVISQMTDFSALSIHLQQMKELEEGGVKKEKTAHQVKAHLTQMLSPCDIRNCHKQPDCLDAVIIVGAAHDAYVPPYLIQEVEEAWQLGNVAEGKAGGQVRWLFGGHVSTIGWQSDAMVSAVVDSLQTLKNHL